MPKRTVKKIIKQLEHRDKVNPGHKNDKYNQPPRPRSTVFKPGNQYDRSDNKRVIEEQIQDLEAGENSI